ncbi:MAG: MFS transporter [Rhodoluna sp.]
MKRSPTLVLTIAGLAYFLAVTQRSSLGVATLTASERFDTNAQQLATLAVFQLVVYAAMQIPVGILLDRFGAKLLLGVGAAIMASGQIIVAFAPTLEYAVLGRMLVGMGDSFTFISMIRMVNGWYSGSKASKMQQYVSTIGQTGQFFSAVPFWFMLETLGWEPAFSIMAAASLLVLLLVIALTANEPEASKHVQQVVSLKAAINQLVENVRSPGIRMAFWTHFSTQPTTTSISLLWAVPYLVTAEGQSHEFAALTLTLMVLFGFVTGPIIAEVCARAPQLRGTLVYSIVGSTVAAWLVLLLVPGKASSVLLLACFLVISVGGPASMVAFDFSKDFAPKQRLGSANGFANVGGFLATFIMMYLTGLVIDLLHDPSSGLDRYNVDSFRWGFAAQFIVIAVGLVFFTLERRKTLRITSL